jgi:peptide/nickel transport system substrate-binding protein
MVTPARAIVAALVVGLAAACSGAPPPSAGAENGGTLTFATDQQPDCLDPQVSARDVVDLIDRTMFDSLVKLRPDGTFHPWLAQSWDISADRLAYTFHLHPSVTFQDGTPLNAAAVKATMDHAVDPGTKSRYAASLISGYTGATVVDDSTVTLRLSRPSAPFLQALSTAYLGIQSPKSIQDNAAGLCDHPVGSGPFQFVKWDKNTSIELKRNPKYDWGPSTAAHTGAARLDGLTVRFITEDTVRFGALSSGQVDVSTDVPAGKFAALRSDSELQNLKAEDPGAPYTVFLNTDNGPLADEKVRLALRDSVDLDALVKSVYFGQYARAWSTLSPATPYYDASLAGSWKHDPGAANKLLDEAGWTQRDAQGYRTKDGKRLTLRWPHIADQERDQRGLIAQGIQAQAKQVGFEIVYNTVDHGTLGQAVGNRQLDLFDVSFTRADPDILRYFFGADSTPAHNGGNIFGLAAADLNGWLTEAATSSDADIRRRDYAQAQHYLLAHAIALPVYVPTTLVGATNKVHGLTFDAQAYPLFYDAWIARQ